MGAEKSKNCSNCKYHTDGDIGDYVCIHPDLLDNGVVLAVSNNEVCADWEGDTINV